MGEEARAANEIEHLENVMKSVAKDLSWKSGQQCQMLKKKKKEKGFVRFDNHGNADGPSKSTARDILYWIVYQASYVEVLTPSVTTFGESDL